jgi:hypothetical protein
MSPLRGPVPVSDRHLASDEYLIRKLIMKLSRALVALPIVAALTFAGLAPAASADTPVMTLTTTGPAQGAKATAPYPVFTWVAPDGENAVSIAVSLKPTVGSDGRLTNKSGDYIDASGVPDGATSYVNKTLSYSPGRTYYWQVAALDGGYNQYVSAVHKFTVPLYIKIAKAKVTIGHMAYNGKRAILASATVTCNYPNEQYYTYFYLDVYRGTKRISHGGQQQGDCYDMVKVKAAGAWAPPASLKSGTKLTVKIYLQASHASTVKFGGAKIPKFTSSVTTLKITWKK